MFRHSRQPQRLDELAQTHPLYGLDLRILSDERLADAAARAILPEWTRFSQHFDIRNSAHSEIVEISGSILRRITRVIVQSTRVAHLTESSDFTVERLDELLESTTLAFIQMVGAFDALAVINGLLSGQTTYSKMAWQSERFRNSVRIVAPAAAALMDDSTPGDLYFQAIRAFRNTIHRRMPDAGTSVRYGGDPAHTNAILILESNGHQEIIETFTAVGWTKFVGIDLAGSEHLFLQPETALRLLKNDGVPLLNALLAATIAERPYSAHHKLDADDTLYPLQMQRYAVKYLRLTHLLPKLN